MLKGLSERLREGNILIGSLQQQLALPDGSRQQHDPAAARSGAEVRYDPYAPLEKVFLYSNSGQYLGTAQRYQRELGAHGDAAAPPAPGKPQHNYVDLLVDQHEQSLQQRSQGIDYRQLPPQRCWAFADFVQSLGQLLGRRGGLSAFSSDELEALSKIYARVDCNEALLRQAVEQSREKTIPAIAFQLQRLSDAR